MFEILIFQDYYRSDILHWRWWSGKHILIHVDLQSFYVSPEFHVKFLCEKSTFTNIVWKLISNKVHNVWLFIFLQVNFFHIKHNCKRRKFIDDVNSEVFGNWELFWVTALHGEEVREQLIKYQSKFLNRIFFKILNIILLFVPFNVPVFYYLIINYVIFYYCWID